MGRCLALVVLLLTVSSVAGSTFDTDDLLSVSMPHRSLLQTTTGAAAPGTPLTPSTTTTVANVTNNSTLPRSTVQARASTGSWLVALLINGGNTTFYNMVSFIPNGGLVSTSQLDYATNTNIQQSTGHGYWIQNGTSIQYKVTKFILDSVGTLVGVKEEFTTGTVDPQAEYLTATNSIITYDLAGNSVRTQRGSITAQRIGLASVFASSGAASTTAAAG